MNLINTLCYVRMRQTSVRLVWQKQLSTGKTQPTTLWCAVALHTAFFVVLTNQQVTRINYAFVLFYSALNNAAAKHCFMLSNYRYTLLLHSLHF